MTLSLIRKTFGVLKYSALRQKIHVQNEDRTVSEGTKERTYDLKSKGQGRMRQMEGWKRWMDSNRDYFLRNIRLTQKGIDIPSLQNILFGC